MNREPLSGTPRRCRNKMPTKKMGDTLMEKIREPQARVPPVDSTRSRSVSPGSSPRAGYLVYTVRSAIRAEFAELFAEGGPMCHAVRREVEAAMEKWGGPSAKSTTCGHQKQLESDPMYVKKEETGHSGMAHTWGSRGSLQSSYGTPQGDYFSKLMRTTNIDHAYREHSRSSSVGSIRDMFARMTECLENMEEPPRAGCLADVVQSNAFSIAVNIMISLNLLFMVIAAEANIDSPSQEPEWVNMGDVIFLAIHMIEMTMKLVVHRQWLFCNASWKENSFDMLLVAAGCVTLGMGRRGGSVLRSLRLLRAARAVRIGKVMATSRHLRSLIVCIQSSVATLFWSLFMLFLVYILFSLLLIETVATHLQETGEAVEETAFDNVFGSLSQTIFTLYKASTGGDDWSAAYQVIEATGTLGIFTYLFFIAFTQFALINIITGIFVDSAIQSLSRDPEALAKERNLQEQENANKLEQFCRDVDADDDGMLTRAQFQDGMRKKHIPLLMSSLGLKRDHVLEFFDVMAGTANGSGQVEISTFVNGCMLLKGAATNFDLQALRADLMKLHADSAKYDHAMKEVLRLLRNGHAV